uniref:Uncharacterized protein n=1 Tax=Anguilla anguilla TaxID=7936 RepID=A0A0E9TGY8_ANGAN
MPQYSAHTQWNGENMDTETVICHRCLIQSKPQCSLSSSFN